MSSVHTWTVFRGAAVAVMMDVKGFTVEKALWDGEELAVIGHKVSHLRRCLCARSCLPPHPGRNPGQRPGCRTREGAGIGSVSRMQDRERTVLPCPWTHCERLAACIFPGSRHSTFQENISQEESGRSAAHCLVNWLKSLRSTMEYLLMSANLINLIIFAVNYIILTKMI